ncbi:BRCA1-A complex subunit Abraxas 1 isoform X2 [Myripristis murdjan]|uniref:BRCA1-A complex subunit Abraxas 1 isoform X2 n=1 Tax=Myripristis murdjan TaxID=586833 RepID=UPI0011763F29|nr:BRCA1-A complex subunit Abraxas 1 isoform X2 [Myripristis murdjan]
MAEPTVRMPGIVLASLMFQHVNSDSDVEGLILGESKLEEQITISDSQADHIQIEEIYNIQKHITCHKLNNFCNGMGEVNLDKLKKILADSKQSVIGWYRQRRNTDQQMTFREKVIHENLKKALSNPHMIFLLLTPSKLTPPGSTHRTEYAAFISHGRQFINVPVLVNNLGLLEQLAYWKVSAACSAAGYSRTMKKHGSVFFNSTGSLKEVNEVSKMYDSLQFELRKACRDVEESERRVETLLADVAALRKRVNEKRGHRMEKDTDAFPPEPKKNMLLHEALEALLSCSPLFQTQTLTLQAFPVPELCCSADSGTDVTTTLLGPEEVSNNDSSRAISRKRLKKVPVRENKKSRKSESQCATLTLGVSVSASQEDTATAVDDD